MLSPLFVLPSTMSPIVLPVDPDLLRPFAFYSALLLAKMVPLPFLIARERSTKGVYENAEDPAFNGLKGKPGKKDEVVERIRRVHRNDMENIFLFLANAAIFVLTQPEVGFAVNLIRCCFGARKFTVPKCSII